MSSETYYYCDICNIGIPHQQVRRIEIRTCASFDPIELDICEECYDKATKGLIASAEQFEKKRFGSILKLWFSKKVKI